MAEQEPSEEQQTKSFAERFREEGVMGAFNKKTSGKKNPNEMHFLEHLEDLRWVILKCIIAFILGCVSVAFFIDESVDVLQKPLVSAVEDFGKIDIDLQSIGLEQYIEPMKQKEIDLGMLRNSDDAILREWGWKILTIEHESSLISLMDKTVTCSKSFGHTHPSS